MSDEQPVRYTAIEDLLAERTFDMAVTTYVYEATLDTQYVFPPDGVSDGEVKIEMSSRQEGALFGMRLDIGFERDYGMANVGIGVNYKFDQPIELTDQVTVDLVNKVALMALYPYAREAFSSLTARVFGEPIMLSVIKQNEYTLQISKGDGTEEGTSVE